MRRLTLLITLLICCLLSLPAQENQQANNPEMEFARMRELAADKDYVHAKQIGYDLLEANEAYHDVALYLARIHGWESSFDSAYALIDRVVEMEPGLYEAYATCADLAYWQNNKQKLEECSGRAIEIEPDSAGAFDSYILALQRAPSLSRQTELFGMYSFDHFSKPYVRNWHMLTAGAELPIKHGTIIPYINAGYQAGGNNTPASDVQFNLDAYLTLGRLNYALLALGFSPGSESGSRTMAGPAQRIRALGRSALFLLGSEFYLSDILSREICGQLLVRIQKLSFFQGLRGLRLLLSDCQAIF
jgi:hypothetical protein